MMVRNCGMPGHLGVEFSDLASEQGAFSISARQQISQEKGSSPIDRLPMKVSRPFGGRLQAVFTTTAVPAPPGRRLACCVLHGWRTPKRKARWTPGLQRFAV